MKVKSLSGKITENAKILVVCFVCAEVVFKSFGYASMLIVFVFMALLCYHGLFFLVSEAVLVCLSAPAVFSLVFRSNINSKSVLYNIQQLIGRR